EVVARRGRKGVERAVGVREEQRLAVGRERDRGMAGNGDGEIRAGDRRRGLQVPEGDAATAEVTGKKAAIGTEPGERAAVTRGRQIGEELVISGAVDRDAAGFVEDGVAFAIGGEEAELETGTRRAGAQELSGTEVGEGEAGDGLGAERQ